MKKYMIIALLLTQTLYVAAQIAKPGWQWARGAIANGQNNIDGNAVATDATGNIYVTGSFNGIADFGSIMLTSTGDEDAFIAKYNSSGILIWAKQFGAAGNQRGNDISIGTDGNVYVSINFHYAMVMGNTTLTSNGDVDVSVAKLDADGNILWAKSGGGQGDDRAYIHGMVLDKDNNIILAGDLSNTGSFSGYNLTGKSYLIKYNADGNIIWAQSPDNSATSFTRLMSVSCDKDGNSYITGLFNKSLTFGATTLTSPDGQNTAYIARYSPAGDLVWAQMAGKEGEALGFSVACDLDKNVYLFGLGDRTIDFGTLTSAPDNDAKFFLVKYDSTGKAIWANRFGGNGFGVTDNGAGFGAGDMRVDNSNSISVLGYFTDSMTLGSGIKIAGSGKKTFVAQFTANGAANWINAGGGVNTEGLGLCTNANGESFVVGTFSANGQDSTANFGTQTIKGRPASTSMFLAKLANVTGINTTVGALVKVQVYPNPVANTLNITGIFKETRIQLFDVIGRTLISVKAAGTTASLNTAALQPGTYMLKLTDSNGSVRSTKVVKE